MRHVQDAPGAKKLTGKQPRNPYAHGTHPYSMPTVNRRPTSRKALRLSLGACVFVCVHVYSALRVIFVSSVWGLNVALKHIFMNTEDTLIPVLSLSLLVGILV